MSFDAGSAQSAPLQRAQILFPTGAKAPKDFRQLASGLPQELP
jgi:hypothetical protein